ncbi:uncharacterized protein LOC111484103 isoform X3 [Cucurbita maxima]|uniref:Nonsense-mediated mRNA decay factor SMG8 n=1 Tax=Cucurbita maxima TaxID=3661 RepID=A0A6J1J788_CUCMA|nr:uncharacterized protein LOC111484103 isoform X3 [Cucurbita maxima]XP_022986329.1 uncharacterized protein LOC111484103 isoform X3 [Cucurbita maxima]
MTNFSKKLQSSLEAQIRFLIKNFWRLNGSRGGRASSYAFLFSLDALKAVVLVDRSANRTAESLEFVISLMEDVSKGQAISDSLLLESHGESASEEDLVSLKEFISRQADILRGGAFTTHELPSMEIWLSSSKRILQGILSAKCGCIDILETRKRKPHCQYVPSASIERNALGIAVSRFSTSWCERVLPGAKEVYLRDLPAYYFKSQHEAHMEKAVLALHLMVKGPAVQHFAERLKEECKSIWISGRQLCDAVSLTGKPYLHQRHSSEDHSSGYVFRHACGCGHSRRL